MTIPEKVQITTAAMITKWRDEALCVRCERPLTSPGPPKNLPSRPTHRSVADLTGSDVGPVASPPNLTVAEAEGGEQRG